MKKIRKIEKFKYQWQKDLFNSSYKPYGLYKNGWAALYGIITNPIVILIDRFTR